MVNDSTHAEAPATGIRLDLSLGFADFLAETGISVALTTYQYGRLFFIGSTPERKLWVHNRNVGRCLGLSIDWSGFWIHSDKQLMRFDNVLQADVNDALFAPRLSYFTGDLDIHDVAVDSSGLPLFVNTRFNCLAQPSQTYNFEPVWLPPFISRMAAEDRCHLNGLAMDRGKAKYVSSVSTSDVFDGWRDHRLNGGVIVDVASKELVVTGLSMPHSPRWYQQRLWLLNSGTGEFGWVDVDAGKFEPVAFCPGYLRGLDFFGNIAVVGMSRPRHNRAFSGLRLDERIDAAGLQPKCGVYFIDIRSGDVVHSMLMEGIIGELYDVKLLPGVKAPRAIGPSSDEAGRTLSLPPIDMNLLGGHA